MDRWDYVFVGAGLTNATLARLFTDEGKRCLVLEKRPHVAGNCHTNEINGVIVHEYGAHIFHTSDEDVWSFVNRFADFNNFVNSPRALYGKETYTLPFCMKTFREIWPDVKTPEDAKARIEADKPKLDHEPKNLEEQAISLVGRTIFEKLVKGYTEKQWGRSCRELSPEIIKRLPLRFTDDDNYFNDKHQGIPIGGYTKMVERMLDGIEVKLGVDFDEDPETWFDLAGKVFHSGCIDRYFGYSLGALEWRSLRFRRFSFDLARFQDRAVCNYTSGDVPWTRTIEHRHFEYGNAKETIVDYEYPEKWERGKEPYYPIDSARNRELLADYISMVPENMEFVGRLGTYKYMDMDDCIRHAMDVHARNR